MKKRYIVGLATGFMVFGLANGGGATLTTVGTANYSGIAYNLIYDNDLQITWLDYTKGYDFWNNQKDWASGLGASLTVSLLPGYTTTNDWTTGWRLPSTVDGLYSWGYDGTTTAGFNITSSEMGHLYYTEMGNKGLRDTNGNIQSGWGLINKGPFDNLSSSTYYSGTGNPLGLGGVWYFDIGYGMQDLCFSDEDQHALAVRPGQVSAVPEPTTMLLMGSGLVGLAGLLRRRRRGR